MLFPTVTFTATFSIILASYVGIATVKIQQSWKNTRNFCRGKNFGYILKYNVIKKRWTQFRTSLYPELYMVCEWSTWNLKEEVLNFQISPLEHSPSAQPCSSVSLEQNGYYTAQDFFAFMCTLKLSGRLLYSVRFVFVSTFNHQREEHLSLESPIWANRLSV